MYKLIIEKSVEKFLYKHRWEKIILHFWRAIKKIQYNPMDPTLDIKPIENLPNSFRLRLWKYRILYEIIHSKISISVFKADTRGDIYKNL